MVLSRWGHDQIHISGRTVAGAGSLGWEGRGQGRGPRKGPKRMPAEEMLADGMPSVAEWRQQPREQKC